MLWKLSIRNIRRSVRDYAIYFLTLVIGVSVFYVFNAIGGQAAMLQVSKSRNDIVQLLKTTISGVSVFVAIVLALLIVYASRFLMKRRNREFALYMLLGMSKGGISALLVAETVIIGLGSLLVGLAAGIGLSQLMSAVVADLFEADMAAYRLSVSGEAVRLTVLYFVGMYLVVMLFHGGAVTRMKLIDLIQSGRKSERIRLRNPVLCVLVFLASVCLLGYAYNRVGWHSSQLDRKKLMLCIILGSVSTFLIFWSVSGMFLRVVMSLKGVYYRGLNAFTFRQVSSKVNTMVFSMSVICLMLFVTICSLASAFSMRNSMNANLKALCPVDMELVVHYLEQVPGQAKAVSELCADGGCDLADGFEDYVEFTGYEDPAFTFATFFGEQIDAVRMQYAFLDYDAPELLVRLSDYNALMKLYGKDAVSLSEDEYILLCDYKNMKQLRDMRLKDGGQITVFGHVLHSRSDACQDGFVDIGAQKMNPGIYVIPDSVAEESGAVESYFFGNYDAGTKEEKQSMEKRQRERLQAVLDAYSGNIGYSINTKQDIREAAVGLGAIVTFLGLYIGLVFLIACGAILALKELSESVDSIPRYEMLRKIGAEEREISTSLFRQTGIFFLLPLLLAILHSVVGMKFAGVILESLGTEGTWASVGWTTVILLLIYGGYFAVTYGSSKRIIRDRTTLTW